MAIGCGVFDKDVDQDDLERLGNHCPQPLQVLASQLLVGPPSIRHLIQLFQNAEYLEDFLKLVRQFLPEHEREIMDGGPNLDVFGRYFKERYFPLNIDYFFNCAEEDSMGEFLRCILQHGLPLRPSWL